MPRIKARSITNRFRRAGITFTKNAGEFDVDKKTLAILTAEPQLVVEVLPDPEPAKAPPGDPDGKKPAGDGKKGK